MANKKPTKKYVDNETKDIKQTESSNDVTAEELLNSDSKITFRKLIKLFKNKKVLIILVALVTLIGGGSWYFASRRTDLTDEMHVLFQGYEGSGHVYLNAQAESTSTLVKRVLAEKTGLNETQVRDFVESPSQAGDSFVTAQDQEKFIKLRKWYDEITVSVNGVEEIKNDATATSHPSKDIKNGDKILVKVDNGNDSSNPIKSSEKTYVVKGLKKVKQVKTKDLFKDIQVSFVGINGIGRVVITSKNDLFDQQTIAIANNGKLKNDDTVSIDFSSILKNSTEKIYTGSKTLKVKVTGLVNASEISNLQALKDKFNVMADKEKNDSSSITNLTFDSIRIVPSMSENNDDSSYFGYSTYDYAFGTYTSKSKKDYKSDVTINDQKYTDADVFVTVRAYYKASYKDASGRDPYYRFKVSGIKLNGNELDLSGVDTDSSSYGSSSEKPTDEAGYLID